MTGRYSVGLAHFERFIQTLPLLEILLDKRRVNGYSIPVERVGFSMDDTSSDVDLDLDYQQTSLHSPQVR